LRTSNGGKSWRSGSILGASKLDFRDIHAVDSMVAWVLSAGDTCKIFFTSNGGASWELQYTNFQPGIFFDGFAFWSKNHAIAYSDPIDEKLFVILTVDGRTWKAIDLSHMPNTIKDEAGFAASGTGICVYGDSMVWIATGGGERSRVMRSTDGGSNWTVHDSPLMSATGMGIFSMVFTSELKGVIVGGSYVDSSNAASNCAVTSNGGVTWTLITEQQPRGYRSCVAAQGKLMLTIGRTGSEISKDSGNTWVPIGEEGYFACAIGNKYAWAVGRNGKIGRLDLEER